MSGHRIRAGAMALLALGTAGGTPATIDVGPPTALARDVLAQGGSAALAADAARGSSLYEKTYRCYACHGYKGESGLPRLVPMARSQESFVAYLRKPATPQMPRFVAVPEQDLVDIHAYLKSLKPESPRVDDVPLLKTLLEQLGTKR